MKRQVANSSTVAAGDSPREEQAGRLRSSVLHTAGTAGFQPAPKSAVIALLTALCLTTIPVFADQAANENMASGLWQVAQKQARAGRYTLAEETYKQL